MIAPITTYNDSETSENAKTLSFHKLYLLKLFTIVLQSSTSINITGIFNYLHFLSYLSKFPLPNLSMAEQ